MADAITERREYLDSEIVRVEADLRELTHRLSVPGDTIAVDTRTTGGAGGSGYNGTDRIRQLQEYLGMLKGERDILPFEEHVQIAIGTNEIGDDLSEFEGTGL